MRADRSEDGLEVVLGNELERVLQRMQATDDFNETMISHDERDLAMANYPLDIRLVREMREMYLYLISPKPSTLRSVTCAPAVEYSKVQN